MEGIENRPNQVASTHAVAGYGETFFVVNYIFGPITIPTFMKCHFCFDNSWGMCVWYTSFVSYTHMQILVHGLTELNQGRKVIPIQLCLYI